ncbi:MAG: glycosyltransferase [Synechococcales cyanobacterium RU_4_20]|nr:glycosyltransferase [Synechococcales cyanobacterium RU_4_20]
MRKLYFLVPGTTAEFFCGGLFAELKTLALAQKLCPAEIATYRQREPEHGFLADLLRSETIGNCIFVLGWGFDTPKLIRQLGQHCVIYHAHSAGYGFRIPARVPIVAVSRNTLGYWGQQANNGLLYHLPNEIADEFCDRHLPRDIDILVQARKSSDYVMQQLIPALRSAQSPLLRVQVLDSFVPDLAGLFNRAKVYLYDSADYWAVNGVTEGFGLPPLEAIACGCQVFSSVNHGLADFLDPGFNCHKISAYSTAYDVERILAAIETASPSPPPDLTPYRVAALLPRLQTILQAINHFFDHQQHHPSDIPDLTPLRIRQLWLRQTWQKFGDASENLAQPR